jgi:hypothetical protein
VNKKAQRAHLVHVKSLGGGNEGPGAAHIEGGDTEELLGVVHASLLEHLGSNGHGGVDWVGDDEESGLTKMDRDSERVCQGAQVMVARLVESS